MKENERRVVLFISSSKIRVRETSHLVAEEVKRRLGNDVKVRFSLEEDLKANEQGENNFKSLRGV